MLQAPFGSTSPVWMGVPSPALPWFSTPMTSGSQTLAALQAHAGYGSTPGEGQGAQLPWGSLGMTAPIVPVPLSTPFVVADGVTAPALMAAIGLRRGQPQGPASDHDVEEFIYDALELLPAAGDVEVRCEGGRVTLSGSVPHKRVKRDVGEIAWSIPGINDVQNTVAITTRRRSRAFAREGETQPSGAGRKQS